MKFRSALAATLGVLACAPAFGTDATPSAVDVVKLYEQHCAACHAVNRLGGMGPALLPENLSRLRKGEAAKVIAEGRAATQMAGFAAQLSKEEIGALTE